MPNILIIGATGYIGHSLALALLHSGLHTVYGIARTAFKARTLSLDEIIPIICPDPIGSPTYLSAIESLHLDTVVDCSGANDASAKILADVVAVGEARQRAYAAAGIRGPKLGFMYVSGTWVHGSSFAQVSDLDPVGVAVVPTQAPRLVSWRAGMERRVLAAGEALDVMVVRPGLVYGRSHAIWSSFFARVVDASSKGEEVVRLPLELDSRPGLVHVDDVASGLRGAVEKLAVINGTGVYPVFDLVAHRDGMRNIFDAFGRAVGFRGRVELVGAGGDAFAEAMSTSANISSERAKSILGWEPKRVGLVEGMEVYAQAFLAAQERP